jgi:hypothetical protein
MVNNQLGELLDRDVPFTAPDQGQSNSGERNENIAYCLPFCVGAKSDEGAGNGILSIIL